MLGDQCSSTTFGHGLRRRSKNISEKTKQNKRCDTHPQAQGTSSKQIKDADRTTQVGLNKHLFS